MMKQYEMFELKFQADPPVNSNVEIDLQAEFTQQGRSLTVKGFYAGNNEYIIRFYPQNAGKYTCKITGIIEAEKTYICEKSSQTGMVRVVKSHFEYENGTKYLPFGTTIYALAHQEPQLIKQTVNTLSSSPFNKVRHCIFPKHYDYNHNEPVFYPFEKKKDGSLDVHHPCFGYWDHLESIIFQLQKMGIESDIILFHAYDRWRFSSLSMEENKIYLDYVLRRLSAVPSVWWSMANEYDIVFSRKENDWYDIETFIVENDPFQHLLSNHNCLNIIVPIIVPDTNVVNLSILEKFQNSFSPDFIGI